MTTFYVDALIPCSSTNQGCWMLVECRIIFRETHG